MVAVRDQGLGEWLKRHSAKIRAYLVFGTDPGLIGERARALAATLAARETPPGEIVRIDEADLDANPDRLAVELLTVPMFGGVKIVRTAAGRLVNAQTVKPLIGGSSLAGFLIIEAGSLRKDDGLRALFEKSEAAAAIACYSDDGASLSELVSEVLTSVQVEIDPDARSEMINRLGADRALSRGELEKLSLYALGSSRITLDDVEAVVGDASELAIDVVLAAAAGGDGAKAIGEFERVVAAGESPQAVILAAARYFQRLHRVRLGLDRGQGLNDALRQLQPPMHIRQRHAFERACRRWTAQALVAALERVFQAARAARTSATLEVVYAERMLLELARLARRSGEVQSGGT